MNLCSKGLVLFELDECLSQDLSLGIQIRHDTDQQNNESNNDQGRWLKNVLAKAT